MTHPHKDKTIEQVKKEIIERVTYEKLNNFHFDTLKMKLGESCMYEALWEALQSLIKEGKVIQSGVSWLRGPIYNLK